MPIVQVNGVGISYELNDFTPFWEPRRTPMLFVHGLGVDHTVWIEQLPWFARQRPVLLVDTRGHGRSDKRLDAEYGIDVHAADLTALVRHLGLEPVIIVGTSMGGLIAQQIAASRPEMVRALVLVSTWAERPSDLDLAEILARFDAAPDLETYYRPVIERTHPLTTDPAILRRILDLTSHHPRETARAGTIATFSYHDPDAAAAIRVPTLVVVGEEEQVAAPERSARLLELIRGSRLSVIHGAGHAPYLEAPQAFNQAVTEFLEREEL
ncbi:MAG: 3-oxoadipate enol-lactonase [Dehalococcoidia bacterium]|nr:MAG: 3-oxoadipate enol-lactonase [Dehalococcoidia bacterium]